MLNSRGWQIWNPYHALLVLNMQNYRVSYELGNIWIHTMSLDIYKYSKIVSEHGKNDMHSLLFC